MVLQVEDPCEEFFINNRKNGYPIEKEILARNIQAKDFDLQPKQILLLVIKMGSRAMACKRSMI